MPQKLDGKMLAVYSQLNDLQKMQVIEYASEILNQDNLSSKWDNGSFLEEMDNRYDYYKSGGKMVSSTEMEQEISRLLATAKLKGDV